MKKILITAPVRQEKKIFNLYLNSLNNLVKEGFTTEYFFSLHNSKHLSERLEGHQYCLAESDNDFVTHHTHHWKDENLLDVSSIKNFLIKQMLEGDYDYMFMVDSDIILHPETLNHLVKQNKDIISEVFWTKWKPDSEEEPNAWMHNFYSFNHLDEIKDWRVKGLYEVGGTGASILIKREVFEKGIDYSIIPNVSFTKWEDRAFCIRAVVHGYKIYLDTHYPAKHLYRKEDVK